MGDLISFIAKRAAFHFGGSDGTFTAAGFGVVWTQVTGLKGGLDGLAVQAMLHGRDDIEPTGGGHYRIKESSR